MARLAQCKSATPSTSTRNQVSLPLSVTQLLLMTPPTVNLFQGLNYLGVPTEFDPNDGTSAGAAFVPTDLDPNNQTRSDARRTYYDPYANRPNMHVITGQHVTRLLIQGVQGNNVVTSPTTGGNQNGNGNANGNPDGFGFGPSANTPPLGGNRFARRADPSSSNLGVTGVEVRIVPTFSSVDKRLIALVRAKCIGTTANGIRHEGGYRSCWITAFCPAAAVVRHWSEVVA